MLKAGDIVGFSGLEIISDVINLATQGLPRWGLSHVGIVADYKDDLVIFESTSLSPTKCLVQRKKVKGVQACSIEDALLRKGKIWQYPLFMELSPAERLRLSRYLLDNIGIDYDYRGAIRSGGILVRFMAHLLKGQDLERLFCSELTAAAFDRIGIIPTSDASSYSPNAFVRRCSRQGVLLDRKRLK